MRPLSGLPWVRVASAFAILSVGLAGVRTIAKSDERPAPPVVQRPIVRPVVKVPEALPPAAQQPMPPGKIQSFVLEIEKRGGKLRHRFVAEHIANGASRLTDRVHGATNAWTPTPSIGPKDGFAGGGGIAKIDSSLFVFDTDAQDPAEFAGNVTWDSANVGPSVTSCIPSVAVPALDVGGKYESRVAIRLRTFSDGSRGWETLLLKNGDRVRVRFFGYLR